MDRIEIDLGELLDFERDLAAIQRELPKEGRGVVAKGALNIKNGWRERWSGHDRIAHLARSVRYSTREGKYLISSAIEPRLDTPQGPLRHLIEFGDAEYGSVYNPPIPGGLPALQEERPKFIAAAAKLAEDVVQRHAR